MCSTSSSSPTPAAPPTPTLSGPATQPQSARLWGDLPRAAVPAASGSAAPSPRAVAAPSASITPTSEAPVSVLICGVVRCGVGCGEVWCYNDLEPLQAVTTVLPARPRFVRAAATFAI